MFKAIELDATSRQRTGRELQLDAETRQAAIDLLLRQLAVSADAAQIDPTRTMIRIADRLWTLVTVSMAQPEGRTPLRRAGAKHKHIR